MILLLQCFNIHTTLFSGVMGDYHQGALLRLGKMAPPKYRVRLICAYKHVTLGVKQQWIWDYV